MNGPRYRLETRADGVYIRLDEPGDDWHGPYRSTREAVRALLSVFNVTIDVGG